MFSFFEPPFQWRPNSLMEFLFLAFGCFFGVIYTLSSWYGKRKGTSYKDDPRVKGGITALTSLFVILIGDWKGILGDADVKKYVLFSFYGVGFMLSAFLTLALSAGFIGIHEYRQRKSIKSSTHPILDYLNYGYDYYCENRKQLIGEEITFTAKQEKEFHLKYFDVLAGTIGSLYAFIKAPNPEFKSEIYSSILDQVCVLTTQCLKAKATNANYMAAVPYTGTAANEYEIKFGFGAFDRYEYLLVLKEYAYPRDNKFFALPVEPRNGNWESLVLPGAPESFLRGAAIAVSTKKVSYSSGIPKKVREEITTYFKNQKFKCFISLPIPGRGGKIAGIINIETMSDSILMSEETQTELQSTLKPYCAILGVLSSHN